MADYEFILVEDAAPGVRRVTLNRPEKRNALNNALRDRGLPRPRAGRPGRGGKRLYPARSGEVPSRPAMTLAATIA